MNVYRDIDSLPGFRKAVITIGTFDGVHLGHLKIIEQLKLLAAKLGGDSVILTFHPHPRFVLNPGEKSLKLLNTIDEKIELLEKHGVENLVVAPFNWEFSKLTAIEYVKDFLVAKFHPKLIVIGYDHKFGRKRNGDIQLLREFKNVFGFEVVEISKQTLEDVAVSSTKVREALNAGNVTEAAKLMGHVYTLSGFVVKGDQIGKTLGFPTANIALTVDYKLIPKNGVYAVKVIHKTTEYAGMLNIGLRPTFEGADRTIEVNIFNFYHEIYGESLQIEFIKRIRDERKFEDSAALVSQLNEDREHTKKALKDEAIFK